MKKIRIPAMLLIFVLVTGLAAVPAAALDNPGIQASHVLLMDADHDEVMLNEGGDEKAYPASITKVMTALLVLEAVDRGELSLDQVVTASATFSSDLDPGGTTQNIKTGEQLTVYQLLQCMLIASANEAANILAETVAGSIPAFVERMNERAAQLGCTGSHFANAHGLHDPEHYTTCRDIYRYTKEAMKNDTFREIVATADCYVDATNMSDQRHFFNTNALLSNLRYAGYVYKPAIGVKTGSTDAAGLCLVAAAEKDGKYLISVVLGAERDAGATGSKGYNQYSESSRLLEWGFDNFSRQTLIDPVLPLAEVAVTLSQEAESVTVHPAGTLEATVPNDLDPEKIEKRITLNSKTVEAPVEEGQVLGTVTLVYEGQEYGSLDLVATNSVSQSALLYRLDRLETFFSHTWVKLLLAVALILVAILVLRLTLFRRSGRRYTGRRGGGAYRNRYTGRRR